MSRPQTEGGSFVADGIKLSKMTALYSTVLNSNPIFRKVLYKWKWYIAILFEVGR